MKGERLQGKVDFPIQIITIGEHYLVQENESYGILLSIQNDNE